MSVWLFSSSKASTIKVQGEVFENGNPKSLAKVLIRGQGMDTILITNAKGKYQALLERPSTTGQINFSTLDCHNKTVTKSIYYLPQLRHITVAFENCPLNNFFYISGNTVANGQPVGKIKFKVIVGEQWSIAVKEFTSQSNGSFFEKINIGKYSFGFFSILVVDCDGRPKAQYKNFFEKDKTTNVDVNYCNTTDYRKILGTVRKPNQTLTKNAVKLDLFKYLPNEHKVIKVDSAENGSYGRYSLSAPSAGKYLVKATPIDNLTYAIPQYFGAGNNWTEGELIFIENQSTSRKNIVLPNEVQTKGRSSINGNTYIDGLFEGDKNPNNYTLILFDESMRALKFAWPTFSGEFSFRNLTAGRYYIHLDVVGLPIHPIPIEIMEDGEVVNDVNLYVNNEGVELDTFSSTEPDLYKTKSALVYPNPFSSELNFSIENKGSNIRIVDMQGRTVFLEKNCANSLNLPTFEWESGVYVIEIQNSTSVEQFKLIKK